MALIRLNFIKEQHKDNKIKRNKHKTTFSCLCNPDHNNDSKDLLSVVCGNFQAFHLPELFLEKDHWIFQNKYILQILHILSNSIVVDWNIFALKGNIANLNLNCVSYLKVWRYMDLCIRFLEPQLSLLKLRQV